MHEPCRFSHGRESGRLFRAAFRALSLRHDDVVKSLEVNRMLLSITTVFFARHDTRTLQQI